MLTIRVSTGRTRHSHLQSDVNHRSAFKPLMKDRAILIRTLKKKRTATGCRRLGARTRYPGLNCELPAITPLWHSARSMRATACFIDTGGHAERQAGMFVFAATRESNRHMTRGTPPKHRGHSVYQNATDLTKCRATGRRSAGFDSRAFAARMLQPSLQGWIPGVPRVECAGARELIKTKQHSR